MKSRAPAFRGPRASDQTRQIQGRLRNAGPRCVRYGPTRQCPGSHGDHRRRAWAKTRIFVPCDHRLQPTSRPRVTPQSPDLAEEDDSNTRRAQIQCSHRIFGFLGSFGSFGSLVEAVQFVSDAQKKRQSSCLAETCPRPSECRREPDAFRIKTPPMPPGI